jgi:hypothetical protein
MSLPFDATLKDLVQSFLPDYERQFGLSDLSPLTPLNVDLSTISAATDIALGHGDPPDTVVDLNFQASKDKDLAARVLLYDSLLHYRFHVPVHSVIVLLRQAADDECLGGRIRYEVQRHQGKMDFSYEVVRLWEQPVQGILQGGLGSLSLAPLTKLPEKGSVEMALAEVIHQIQERLTAEASSEDSAKIIAGAYVLSGLRLSRSIVDKVFQGVRTMKESSTYQGILEDGRVEGRAEGRVQEARKILLRQGRKKLKKPSPEVEAALQAITDLERLERMSDRLLTASSWEILLKTK